MSTTAKKEHINQTRDAASQTAERAEDTLNKAGETAQKAAAVVGDTAEELTAQAGKGVQCAADTVRKQGPNEGMLGDATQAVANTLDSTGKYLEDKNLSGMVDDVNGLIKRNPLPAVMIGLGIGFLIGRALSPRS